MFQTMQAVKIINDKSEKHGEAGCVVGNSADGKKVDVRLDSDNAVYEFRAAELQAL